jgi:[ribosomal protein S18]-alanine N-acetyltransferase
VWWDVAGEQSLLTIATAPDARRRGFAAALLEHMLTEGTARGSRSCFLEVRASNEAAIALYRRLGFEPHDVRRRYYADGEDAAVMLRRVPSA